MFRKIKSVIVSLFITAFLAIVDCSCAGDNKRNKLPKGKYPPNQNHIPPGTRVKPNSIPLSNQNHIPPGTRVKPNPIPLSNQNHIPPGTRVKPTPTPLPNQNHLPPGYNSKPLSKEYVEKEYLQYFLTPEDIYKEIESIERKPFQEKYQKNPFKGANNPSFQKLERIYAIAKIAESIPHNIRYGSSSFSFQETNSVCIQDYISRVSQDESLIKLMIIHNRIGLCANICMMVRQRYHTNYAVYSSYNDSIGIDFDQSIRYGEAYRIYFYYVFNQLKEALPAEQLMTFEQWRNAGVPDRYGISSDRFSSLDLNIVDNK